MGCGGLLVAAGGISLATGIGIGATASAKGATRMVRAYREKKKLSAEEAQHSSEGSNSLIQIGEKS